jgi:capsular polysaccharide biosynthesis protein
MPFEWKGGLFILVSPKITKIEAHQTKSHDIMPRLRATWFYRVYTSYLKRYSIVRLITQWIWRNGYPLYANYFSAIFVNRKAKKWRPLIALSELAKSRELSIYKLVDTAIVDTPEPRVFPSCDQGYLVSLRSRYEFPQIFVAAIKNAVTYGGSNLILAEGEVVCHDLYDFKRDYTSEELHGRTLIDPEKGRIRWLLHDETPEHLFAAAVFVDGCAPNYAHWMTEVLPRIAVFCAEEQFKDIPIVINDGLHKNIMESLTLVLGIDREIVTLPIGRAVQIDELYITSVTGYVPFERRNNKISGHSHGLFSPYALKLIRKQVLSFGEELSKQTWPEKIYLRRNSGVRKVKNAAELERILIAKGYVIVEPEKLSFLQQTQIFAHAKVIIGSSGAALANILFAPSNVKIIVLISKYPGTSYGYWQNIACALGLTISYVFGEICDCDSSGIHADFTVELERVFWELGDEL